jgi:hypothetical protein
MVHKESQSRSSPWTTASLIFTVLLALLLTGCSKSPPKVTITPQTVSFAGLTNGYVGVIAPFFATINTNNAAAIQQWLAGGTNSAVFIITNCQSCDIRIVPFARILNAGGHPTSTLTPLVNAPSFSGIFLKPGQVTNLEVALFPHHVPWRVQIHYTRSDRRVGLIEQLNHLMFQKPIVTQTIPIDSDLIDQ